MNRLALSLLLISASGVYVWDQWRQQATGPLDLSLLGSPALAAEAPADLSAALPSADSKGSEGAKITADCDAPKTTPSAEVEAATQPAGLPRITHAAMLTVAASGMTDGTYTGPTTDAYYGPMQIQAVVQGGKLVKLRALQYPSDRRTSLLINRQALPMLRDEALAAQTANVDIVTGATLTSKAFIRSLQGALAQAGQ